LRPKIFVDDVLNEDKKMRFLVFIFAVCCVNSVSAVQHVDLSFESPVKIAYGVNELGSDTNIIVYDKVVEDGETFYGVTQKYGTNRLWISETESYKGGRSLAASCYAVNTYFKDRAEFRSVQLGKDYALTFGQEMYYGYAMKIDSNSTPPPSGMHIMQGYQNFSESQIPLTLSFHGVPSNGVWRFTVHARTLTSTRQIGVCNFTLGEWYKLVWRLRPNYPGFGGTGLISLWINDEEILTWNGDWGHEPTGEDDEDLDLRCGVYRGSCERQQTIFYDQIKYADSYSEADPDTEIEWGFHSGTDGWTVRNDIQDLMYTNDCIQGVLSGPDGGLLSPDQLNLDCGSFPRIIVRMKNATAGTLAAFYFTTVDSPEFSQGKRVETALLIKNDDQYALYEFDMTTNPEWAGTLKQLRFDPVDQSSVTSGTFSIDFIDLTSAASMDNLDSDQDGFSNQQEIIAGTDPYDAKSYFAISQTHNLDLRTIELLIPAVKNRNYSLSASTNLMFGSWKLLDSLYSADESIQIFSLSNEYSSCFIRVNVSLP
jgi:hypothetical protein